MEDIIVFHLALYNLVIIYMIYQIKSCVSKNFNKRTNYLYYYLGILIPISFITYIFYFYESENKNEIKQKNMKEAMISITMINIFDFIFQLFNQTIQNIRLMSISLEKNLQIEKFELDKDEESEQEEKEEETNKEEEKEENLKNQKKIVKFKHDKTQFNLTDNCKKEVKDLLKNCDERQIRILFRILHKHINSQEFWIKNA